MASHEPCIGATDEWYTPPWVFAKLGIEFETDAASPGADIVPWIPARTHIIEDALSKPWKSPVWLNPPYGGRNGIRAWGEYLFGYEGILLVPNRTATDWWQDCASRASQILFLRHKIRFLRPDGSEGRSPGYGNVFMAFGRTMGEKLALCQLEGLRA